MKLSEVKERPSLLPTRPSVYRNSTDLGGSEILMHFSGIFCWRHFCISVSTRTIHHFSLSHIEKHKKTHIRTHKHTRYFFPELTSLTRSTTEITTKSPQHHYNNSSLQSFLNLISRWWELFSVVPGVSVALLHDSPSNAMRANLLRSRRTPHFSLWELIQVNMFLEK